MLTFATTGLNLPAAWEVWTLLPEIILVLGMCVALILPVLPPFRKICRESRSPMTNILLVSLVLALLSCVRILMSDMNDQELGGLILGGMLSVDRFALTFKVILYLFTIMVVCLWITTTREGVRTVDAPDYITLILGGVLGMGLMASAANFLMIFLAIEAASFPSYALAGFRKTTRKGSEASLKYVLFGSASSAIMLYGLSMLYGGYGTLDVATIAMAFATEGMSAGLMMGLFGFIIGLGFKLSAVPMHFWCPDVFEGASFEITTFLSVASKGAAIILLLRVMLTLGYYMPESNEGALVGIGSFVALVGLVTATWGNLAAYFQDNIKRLLAYSSIAHAGYMIMAAAMITATMQQDVEAGQQLAYAILFYLFVYAAMNLGAFTIAAVVERATGSESLKDYAGLGVRNPALAIALGCFLMSLFGMPLTGGFWGKVRIGFEIWSQGSWAIIFVVGLVLNTVFSLYFYLKPIIYMVWKPAADRTPIPISPAAWMIIIIGLGGVFLTGLAPDPMTGWARENAIISYRGPQLAPAAAVIETDPSATELSSLSSEGAGE